MTLKELQKSLTGAGMRERTCVHCAQVLVLDGHCESIAQHLTPQQAAEMLWLCAVSDSETATKARSKVLRDQEHQPRRNGEAQGETVQQFLAYLISSPRAAAELVSMHVDCATGSAHFANYDTPPQQFQVSHHSAQLQPSGSVAVAGSVICRIAVAFSHSAEQLKRTI